MALPKAVRAVGTIDKARIVYIEDYVLQYLTVCEEEEEDDGTETVLYGKKEISGGTEIYFIYGICRQRGQGLPEESIGEGGKGKAATEAGRAEEAKTKKTFPGSYRRLGHLDPDTGGIILDDWGRGQMLTGYYVFFDAEEKMKDDLGKLYERRQRKKRQDTETESIRPDGEETSGGGKDRNSSGDAAELVALSNRDRRHGKSPFLWVRMAVLCIFIIFCAIAVMTVNSFDKLHDFIQTAVMTGEMIDREERN